MMMTVGKKFGRFCATNIGERNTPDFPPLVALPHLPHVVLAYRPYNGLALEHLCCDYHSNLQVINITPQD